MPLFHADEADAVEAVAALLDCNPFLPERVEFERRVLGSAFLPAGLYWHSDGDEFVSDPNRPLLCDRVEALAATLRERLAAGTTGSKAELDAYRGLVLYLLWLRYEDDLYKLIPPADGGVATAADPVPWYDSFARDAGFFLSVLPGPPADVPHLFALAFQARRAFDYVFRRIFGGSLPAAQLRAAVWQSVFTADMRGYRDFDYASMRDSPTLITGESGTGKDLVACAIGMSQYIPFDAASRRFADASQARYFAVNPSALSPTLIESELFGHERGAFTDAVAARSGWFESCGPYGAIFLDEIGELAAVIQVKLLRLLHNRRFERIGDTTSRRFEGKLIAATNRDLREERRADRFRDDIYFRLNVDRIVTPTLRAQLADRPEDLDNLVLVLAKRIVGEERAPALAQRTTEFVRSRLGEGYAWPGNVRELEQCVKAVRIRGEYVPEEPEPSGPESRDPADELADRIRSGTLKAKELTAVYAQIIHAQTGNIHETARRTGLDRKTVEAIVNKTSEKEG